MEITLFHVFTLVLLGEIFKQWRSMRKIKTVWVVEDSETEIQLFKMNLEFPDVHIKYFRTLKNIGLTALFNPPDAVIADYMLEDQTRGDALLKFFKRNGIPALLVTGYEGEILGLKPSEVVHKRADNSHYDLIEGWIKTEVLT